MVDESTFSQVWAVREAAYWAASAATAAWMVGLLGLAVNAGGLWMLWRQLQANRAALEYASTSANAAAEALTLANAVERAWLTVTVDDVGYYIEGERGRWVRLTMRTENIGKTPATNVSLSTSIIAPPDPDEGMRVLGLNAARAHEEFLGQALFPGEKHWEPHGLLHRGQRLGWSIAALVKYRLAGQDTPRWSARVYEATAGDWLSAAELAALPFQGVRRARRVEFSPSNSYHLAPS